MTQNILIILVHVAAILAGIYIYCRHSLRMKWSTQKRITSTLTEEYERRHALLLRTAKVISCSVPKSTVVSLRKDMDALVEKSAELTKQIAVANEEVLTAELRLRDLEEIERELDNSNFEAARELEELRSKEAEISGRNVELRTELKGALGRLDELLKELRNAHEVVEKLNMTKIELVRIEGSIDWYENEVNDINTQYSILKNAYDALDIEYAQLYEKQGDAG